MKKSQIGVSVALVLAALVAGCATGSGGASDAEKIDALLNAYKAAALAADIDAIMALVSENFVHDGYEYQAEGKDELQEFMEEAVDMGYFENVEISYEYTETTIEGDAAEVYPIDFANDQGSVTITLLLTKEKGNWLITDMEIEGL